MLCFHTVGDWHCAPALNFYATATSFDGLWKRYFFRDTLCVISASFIYKWWINWNLYKGFNLQPKLLWQFTIQLSKVYTRTWAGSIMLRYDKALALHIELSTIKFSCWWLEQRQTKNILHIYTYTRIKVITPYRHVHWLDTVYGLINGFRGWAEHFLY